ncbi:DUF3243 domain-containing protein [Paenibacillus macquariensis]|uniref:DUF3243 domain-containing protein n=1 Tax=Paenibacillus macquariensis TaxID=948756 RepID=A0ABY1K9N7_9BACL|nr:DUF3243 domain-containing protein [Paenibacillus macquariensis]MEC0092443.1 DUF3243 domain-containing protein [Paenibacillus macquariensis]OAB35406.1 hypothetical protein PMSM_09105 [Paenibacillus macquariensis subsp. macquariensis]SIR47323.1 Protein of unknown function [Paenibacillus macquariensis]
MSEYNHVVNKDGEVDMAKVDDVLDRISESRKEGILSDFDSFQKYLNKRIDLGKSIGLSDEQLVRMAEKIASYLSDNEEPRNHEEKLLQELWKVGTPEEQHSLSHLLVKLAQTSYGS